jgi:hypothetical protein
MRSGFFPVIFWLTVVGSAFAAERLHIVGPVIGYQCMALNLTVEQTQDPNLHVPVYAGPSASAQVVGYASLQVAVRSPLHEVNGFVEALSPTGNVIWIKGNVVRPYHSLADPTARCVSVKFSNGRYGFDYPHS